MSAKWWDGRMEISHGKTRKRRQLKNLIGALENSHTKIYSQKKVNRQLGKIPEQNYRKFHHILLTCTLLLPGAVQSWSVPVASLKPEWSEKNRMCNVPTYLGTAWRLLSVPLNSKLKLKSSWRGYYSYRRNIYIYIYTYIHTGTQGQRNKGGDID